MILLVYMLYKTFGLHRQYCSHCAILGCPVGVARLDSKCCERFMDVLLLCQFATWTFCYHHKWFTTWKVHHLDDLQYSGWPLSRHCEIPWHFPDGLQHSSAAQGMLSVSDIMPVLVLNTYMDANMQFTINSFRQLFPDKIFSDISLIFSKIPDISLTAVKFPDISRFSRQVVTMFSLQTSFTYWTASR